MGSEEPVGNTFIPNGKRVAVIIWRRLSRRVLLSLLFVFLSVYAWIDPEACAKQFKDEVH